MCWAMRARSCGDTRVADAGSGSLSRPANSREVLSIINEAIFRWGRCPDCRPWRLRTAYIFFLEQLYLLVLFRFQQLTYSLKPVPASLPFCFCGGVFPGGPV